MRRETEQNLTNRFKTNSVKAENIVAKLHGGAEKSGSYCTCVTLHVHYFPLFCANLYIQTYTY